MNEGYTNPVNLPQTPAGWRMMAIDDICDKVTSGGTPLRSNTSYYQEGTYSWFKTKELKDSILYESEEKITDKALEQSSAKIFPKGTVLMAMYGDGKTITSLGILSKEAATNQACCAMIPNPNLCNSRFLFYSLRNHRDDFIQIASGGAQRNLSGKVIRRFALNVPPLSIQNNIAHVLGTLDDKIHLNTQINQTLESMAQAIFKSWFVDFDPVKAKIAAIEAGEDSESVNRAAMRAISGKSDDELDKMQAEQPDEYAQLEGTAKLFPAAMWDSELGEVPEGWTVKPLPDVIDFLEGPGIRNWQYTEEEDGIKFINIRCIKNGDLELDTASKLTKEEALGKYKHFQLEVDDIVISTSGTLGRYAFVREEHLPLSLNTSVIRLKPIAGVCTLHFLRGYTDTQLQFELEMRASGSAQRNFGPMHLKQIEMLVPDLRLLNTHSALSEPFFRLRQKQLKEIGTLSQIRDTLLPKLLSGELSVENIELSEANV